MCSTPHSVCANTLGSFTCSCAVGFTGGGTVSSPCVDVDECAPAEPGLVPCSGAHETCTNTPGSFLCGCGSGYASAHDGCTNVDECAERDGTVACPANNTQCTDTEGSFSCSCSAGYEPPLGYALVDGTIPGGAFGGAEGLGCVDVDECAVSQGLCVRREVRNMIDEHPHLLPVQMSALSMWLCSAMFKHQSSSIFCTCSYKHCTFFSAFICECHLVVILYIRVHVH